MVVGANVVGVSPLAHWVQQRHCSVGTAKTQQEEQVEEQEEEQEEQQQQKEQKDGIALSTAR